LLISPLTMAEVTSAVAADGNLYVPHVVMQAKPKVGGPFTQDPQVYSGGQVFSPDTAAKVRQAMWGVSSYGTGSTVAHNGIHLADSPVKEGGKTGTAQLESGLWVLNDPQGGLLVSPMRGESGWEPGDSAVPLTPRYETLTAPKAEFVWNGGPAMARVVVAKRREVVWKSAPTAPGTILDAGTALVLAAGEVYTWWLEPEAGGAPLTAGVPFRIAAPDVIGRTKAVENELRGISGGGEDPSAVDYLRIAFYAGAASWTRVLELATRMAPSDARSRALEAAAAGLRLDPKTASQLAAKLATERKR
jgi:hypothetical protein